MNRTTRNLGLTIITIMICMAMLPTASFAQNDQERIILSILDDGETVTDEFVGDVGTKLYAFNASMGDSVTVSMTQISEELDPYLVLLGPAGEVIASDDDSGSESLAAEISGVTLPADGGYFIVASSYTNIDSILESEITSAQKYTLSVNGITPPVDMPDYSPDNIQYFRGDLVANTPAEGASTPEEPVYYYLFYGQAEETITITLESDDFDPVLHLFNATGSRIAVNDDDLESTGFNSAIRNFTLPEDGPYLVFATDVFFYNAGDDNAILGYEGGDFTISLITQ